MDGQDSTGFWVGIGGTVVGVLGAVGGILKWRAEQKTADRKTTIEEYQALLASQKHECDEALRRLEAQMARLDRQTEDLQRTAAWLHEECTTFQLELSDFYGYTGRLHDIHGRNAEAMRKAGLTPEAAPDIPPRRPRTQPDPDFLWRTAQTNAILTKTANNQAQAGGDP